MKRIKKVLLTGTALAMAAGMTAGLCSCGRAVLAAANEAQLEAPSDNAAAGSSMTSSSSGTAAEVSDQEYIEEILDLANNEDQEWTYQKDADAWVLSVVSAVAYPEIEDEQGVSVCVPGAYVKGIDTDGDGKADVTASGAAASVKGSLVIDYDAEITSSNGQVYTAATAPLILNTGAAGYGSQNNQTASTQYAVQGYINIACGNRGKQDTAEDDDGESYYTGDAPSCLVDQKNAARFVKYNILLGNLPGNADYLVSTGGSGGGAHAAMFAATSNNSDFYDYEADCGAVGVYRNEDGSFSTTVTVDGRDYEISDGAWGCIAYSAITSLYEADMALAFEYNLDTDYSFKTDFQKALASYLSEEYMEYINEQDLSVKEADADLDINGDGDKKDTIDLSIEYDEEKYADTNGYGGTYLDLYLAEFVSGLQSYVDNLDYGEGWTWFDEDGKALSDEETAEMTAEDKAQAFIEGRYTKGSTGSGTSGGPGGTPGDMCGTPPDMDSSSGNNGPGGNNGMPPEMSGTPPDMNGERPEMNGDSGTKRSKDMEVGTPDAGVTQSNTGSGDSSNYDSYEEMLKAYEEDIAEILEGDEYGNNIVSLYNPLKYIGDKDTESPAWVRIVMGASEGDISMLNSLNMEIAWLSNGTDAGIEWQWDGGHVPSEILGDSFSLYVDQMYGEYAEGAVKVKKAEAEKQTENGTAEEAAGKVISSWVKEENGEVSFSLADAAAYRTAGASKATPGFDVIDYGQEDYVFGSSEKDARHWDETLLKVLKEHQEDLEKLFNS